MKRKLFSLTVLTICLLPLWPASAQEKSSPADVTVGVLTIHMNSEYSAADVDGESWEEMYYTDDGMSIVLEGFDRLAKHTVKLTPLVDELKPAIVEVTPKDWKLAKLDRVTRQWQSTKKVKFSKWKPGEREALEKAQQEKEKAGENPPADAAVPPETVPDSPAAVVPDALENTDSPEKKLEPLEEKAGDDAPANPGETKEGK